VHRERREDVPALGNQREARPRPFERFHPCHVSLAEKDAAGARDERACDGFHQRGLAGAVGAEETDGLSRVEAQARVAKYGETAVAAFERIDGERGAQARAPK